MLKLWNDSSLTCEIIWNFSFLFMFRYNHDLYDIQIRSHERLHLYPLRTSNAHSAMRHRIQELLCRFPTAVLKKSRTHSITSFASHAKFHLIDSYCSECVIPQCYICVRSTKKCTSVSKTFAQLKLEPYLISAS